MRTGLRRSAAIALALGLVAASMTTAAADEIELDVEIPALTDEPFEVTDAQLSWGLNEETGSGAFAGGCNFLSAGAVGDTGGSKVWTAEDPHFATRAGDVTIMKPVATSRGTELRAVSFAERCTDARGRPVSTSRLTGTGVRAVIDGGTGRVDPRTGDARISWRGSVSVVFYGGMTYWWFSDPVLELRGGKGTLTATAGGFGTDREDMTRWRRLTPTKLVLAELSGVSLRGAKGLTAQPAYLGEKVSVPSGAPAQLRAGEHWGSFPQSFVDFQEGTGQQSFWYSSGGARDGAKPASPLVVSYDAAEPEDDDLPDPDDGGDAEEPDDPGTGPRPPSANPPPVVDKGTGALGEGPAGATAAIPNAVPAVTIMPIAAPASTAEALAETGGPARSGAFVLALVAVLLGAALTALGYRSGWLAWPGRKKVTA